MRQVLLSEHSSAVSVDTYSWPHQSTEGLLLTPENFIGLPKTFNVRAHRMSVADAVAALADGINGCALGGGTDATDALHGICSVDQGYTAVRGRYAHLICSSKSLLRGEKIHG